MDLSLADGIYPALVVALAYVVLGLTGFASSLIAVPLLICGRLGVDRHSANGVQNFGHRALPGC